LKTILINKKVRCRERHGLIPFSGASKFAIFLRIILSAMKTYLILPFIFIATSFGKSATPASDQIVGLWRSPDTKVLIKINKVGRSYQARIVWVENSEDSNLLDKNNPNRTMQRLPIIGNKIIKNLTFNAEELLWEGGTFYHFAEGAHYICHVKVQSKDVIQIIRCSSNGEVLQSESWRREK
jgi:uncharacterized protein (DUF2147 family)